MILNEELKKYIENNIFPQYSKNEKGHQLDHINYVINRCLELSNNEKLTEEELLNMGVNPSKNHVDFMIGTSDLEIEADTNKGKILIFKNGNYNI